MRIVGLTAALALVVTPLVAVNVAQAANAACAPYETTVGSLTTARFTDVGTCDWTIPVGVTHVEALIIGGGGAGGHTSGGGGGAGAVVEKVASDAISISGSVLAVSVGDGGSPGTAAQAGGNGQNSSFAGLTALGGGGGGSWGTAQQYFATDGGSGGGRNGWDSNSGVGLSIQSSTYGYGLGHDGGTHDAGGSGGGHGIAGGGGGAGGAGGNGTTTQGGAGGYGYVSALNGGICLAGGGGGGTGNLVGPAGAGKCGGGTGGWTQNETGASANANTGSGGGGGGSADGSGLQGGSGGSGIVILRYSTEVAQACAPTETVTGSTHVLSFNDTGACNWTIPAGVSSLRVLAVGGGGAGGNGDSLTGGGGGAGGSVVENSSLSVTAGSSQLVQVGTGGTPFYDGTDRTEGGASWFGDYTSSSVRADGGGYGGSIYGINESPSRGGGSGGSGYEDVPANALQYVGAINGPNGHSGGAGVTPYVDSSSGHHFFGAGGGGAGAGADGSSGTLVDSSGSYDPNNDRYGSGAGAGGAGVTSTITGSSHMYGAGAGGGDWSTGGASGGEGAGAGGCGSCSSQPVIDGTANTGGAGGGTAQYSSGMAGYGGSGVVIVSYSTGPSVPGAPTDLGATAGNGTLTIACTDAPANGAALSNYKYSTDGGSSWKALSPVDTACPVTISTISSGATGLTNGTTYSVQLRGVNSVGDGTPSSTLSAAPAATVPGAPSITSVAAGNASATVNCSAPVSNGGATITNYKYSLNGGAFTALSPADATCPLTIPDLTNGTSYTVAIEAVNSAGDSAPSSTSSSFTPSSGPAAPVISTITPSSQSLSVACTDAVNPSASITNYQYSTDGGSTWKLASPVTTSCPVVITKLSASNTNLTNGASYNVQLRAYYSNAPGTASATVAGTPAGVPSAPTGLSASTADSATSVSCTLGANNGSALSNIEYSKDGGTTWITPDPAVTTCPVAITGLTNGTSYSIKLREINAIGTGTASSAVSVTPKTAPGSPTITSITPGNQSLTVACTDAAPNGASLTNYEYTTDMGVTWRALSPSDSSCPLTITKTSTNNSTLVNGTSYAVTIRGVNSVGSGANPSKQDATPMAVPAAPTSLRSTSGDGSVSIACTLGAANGSPISNINYSIDGGLSWITPDPAITTCPVIIQGLNNGTTYSVKLREVNEVGLGAISSAVSATPRTTPSAPVISSIAAGNATLTVACTDAPANGNALTNYEYTTDGGTTWRLMSPTDTSCPLTITKTSDAATTLVNGTTYRVKIRGVNDNGSGAESNLASRSPATVPSAPTSLSATVGNGYATVDCTLGADGGSDVTALKYSIDNGLSWITTNDTTCPLTIQGLNNGTTYTVKLREVNANGDGSISSSIKVKPVTTPAAPTAITATRAKDGKVSITLTPGDDGGSQLTNYKYSTDGGKTWTTIEVPEDDKPIVIKGLSSASVFSLLLREVNALGDGEISEPIELAAVTQTPTPTPSMTTLVSQFFKDISELIDEITNSRDECDKTVNREVCQKETGEKLKEASDSAKEKTKEATKEAEKKSDEKDKEADESEKHAKDKDDEADESEKHAKDKDDEADKSEKHAKDKDDEADKSEKKADESEKKVKDDEKEVKDDETKLKKDEKDLKDDEDKNKPQSVIESDKKDIKDDKDELEKDKKKLEEDEKKAEKDREEADNDRKDADEAEKEAKKKRDEADEAEKEAKKKRDEADEAEKEAKKKRDEADEAEKEVENAKENEQRAPDLQTEAEKLKDADDKDKEVGDKDKEVQTLLYPGAQLKNITICHATASLENPYVTQRVAVDSWTAEGHASHDGSAFPAKPWGDIVPGQSGISAQNFTTGESIWSDNCLTPEQVTELATAEPTPWVEPSVPGPSAPTTIEPTTAVTNEPSASSSPEPSASSSQASAEPSTEPSASESPTSEPSASASETASPEPSASSEPTASEEPTLGPSAPTTIEPTPTVEPTPIYGPPTPEFPTPEPSPSESLPPVDVPEVIDEIQEYQDLSEEYRDTVVENIAEELDTIDEESMRLMMLPPPEVLVDGIDKENKLIEDIQKLWNKLDGIENRIVDPKASPELISAVKTLVDKVRNLHDGDVRLAKDRAGIEDEFPWWAVVLALLILAVLAGIWIIIAWRRKRVQIDFDKCVACGLCYEKFPELFAKGPGGRAVVNRGADDEHTLFSVVERKHYDDVDDIADQCEADAIRFSRRVRREVKNKQRDLNR